MNLEKAQVGDKIAFSRYGASRIFTVTNVGARYLAVQNDATGSKIDIVRSTGKLRGADNFTHAWIATEAEITADAKRNALARLDARLSHATGLAREFTTEQINELIAKVQLLFESNAIKGSL